MSSKYLVNGKDVLLSNKDFVAQGGQGSVYIKGKTAYKIYTDLKHMIPLGKITELSALDQDYIVKPDNVIYDKNKPVGYTMQALKDAYALCQMFPKAFRTRKNLDEKKVFSLVQQFQKGVKFVHSKNVLIVDVNELNFSIDDNFDKVYFLDVDSYQTKSYPATALMESVKDWHANGFNQNTDWFSWAVVSFQMFVGIHPFKGMYDAFNNVPKEQRLAERMKKNISVFHKDVRMPAVVLPFDVIPTAYRAWYESVFEKGLREAPPESGQLVIIVPTVKHISGSSIFDITEAYSYDSDIVSYQVGFSQTRNSLYSGKKLVSDKLQDGVKVTITPRRRLPVAISEAYGKLSALDLYSGASLNVNVLTEALMSYNGIVYYKYDDSIYELRFVEAGNVVMTTGKVVAKCMPKATTFFDGVAITNTLGRYHAIVIPEAGLSYQPGLKELDGYQIVDAKFRSNVLVITAVKGGQYDNFVYRYSPDFKDYDLRIISNMSTPSTNFTVLDNGLVIMFGDNDEIQIFSSRPHSANMKTMYDDSVKSDVKLVSEGAQAMFIRGEKLYKFSMKTK